MFRTRNYLYLGEYLITLNLGEFMTNNSEDLRKKASLVDTKRIIKALNNGTYSRLKSRIVPAIYSNSLLGKVFYPNINAAYLELTNNCNLKCKMCIYEKLKQKTGFMSRSLFKSCVNQLSEMGVGTLYLHFGGESLVHPNFKEFLKYAISKRNQGKIKNVSWFDNGMLFNQAISDLVIDLHVDSIAFSVDGVGSVNDKIRQGSNYSIIERNIKYLIEKRGNATKPEIVLSMCDYGKTEEQKMDVYREWVPFVDYITHIPSILPDNTWENKDESASSLKIISAPKFCSFPFNTMAISWDGRVTGCCLDYIFKMGLGDATCESLKDIWRGQRYRSLRKAVMKKTFSVGSPCRTCEFWQINFEPRQELILNGAAKMTYGYIYRKIEKNC